MAHFFGKKERLSLDPTLQQMDIKHAIGKTIVCEDGIGRRVVDIVNSYQFPWRAVINETDEESNAGHFVNLLSLACQVEGKSVPTLDQQAAFARFVKNTGIVNVGGDVPVSRKLD